MLRRLSPVILVAACLSFFATSARADYREAKFAFESEPLPYRYTIQMLLGVAGYWPVVANDELTPGLFKAIGQFQRENGLSPTGEMNSTDLTRLHALADPYLNRWGMTQIRHPYTGETLWIPQALAPIARQIPSGVEHQAADDSVAIAFNHFDRTGLKAIYRRLMAQPRDTLVYEKLKPDFFVIATVRGNRSSYSRFHATPSGVTGFTLSWENNDEIQGGRISTLMSDLFRAEMTLGQDRYPPKPVTQIGSPAVSNRPSYYSSNPSPPTGATSFSPKNAPAPDPVALAQEQARVQQEQARAAELQQQKVERLIPAARQLVDDAATLIKTNPSHPKLLEFVEMINDLNKAINDKEANAIDKKSMALSGALRSEPAFAAIETKRVEEQKRANAKFLGDAIALGQRQKGFMLSYVAKEPTSTSAAAFLPLIRQFDPAIAKANLSDLQTLSEKADLTIRQASLATAFAAWSPATADATPEVMRVVATNKNRFLLDGDLGDLVLTMNASAASPHIAKNLRGEIVFENNEASACFYQTSVDDELALTTKAAIQRLGAANVHLWPSCDRTHLEQYDIIAANRGAFLKNDQATALALIKQIETEAFKPLSTISASDLKTSADDRAKSAAAIAADVAAGAREGFGVILVRTGAPTLCTIVADKADGHHARLIANGDRLALDMGADPVLSSMTAEAAFVAIQRNQCGALYGSAKDLKDADVAMSREHIDHHFSSLWFRQAEIDTAHHTAVAAKARAAQEAADRQRQAEDERKLAAQRASDAASTNAAKQEALRKRYGRSADAAAASIASELKDFAASRSGSASLKWPAFANWLNEKFADHWEIVSFNSETADYGVSNWKDRQLDTAFTRITVKLKNRMLGEYQDACFVAGQITDNEFSMDREPVLMPCERANSFDRWKTGHRFESRWIIN